MEGFGLGNYTGVETGEIETQRVHRNKRNMGQTIFQYLWHLVLILLVIGTLIGLKLGSSLFIAAQYRVTMAGVEKTGNFSPITNQSVVSKNLERGPDLLLLPVGSIQGTNLIDVSKLRVKRSPVSSHDKPLVRKKRVAPVIQDLE